MPNKHVNEDGNFETSKRLRRSIWFKDHVEKDFDHAIAYNNNGGNNGGLGKEIDDSLERDPAKVEENLMARLLYAPENLESNDVGLKFQFKMLELMNSVYQELKHDKEKRARQDKMIKLLMMECTGHFSLTNKLAKVNMPNTLSKFGNVRNIKKHLLEIDNYYDVQRPEQDNKVSIGVTTLKDYEF